MQHFRSCPLDPAQYPAASALYEALGSWRPPKSRVRNATRAALCMMITGECNTAREAARAAGMSEESLYRFRASSNGKTLIKKLQELHMEDSGFSAFVRIVKLATQEKNLSVAMRANEWLAAMGGYTPAKKVEVAHSGEVKTAGMMVIHPDVYEAMSREEREGLFGGAGNTDEAIH